MNSNVFQAPLSKPGRSMAAISGPKGELRMHQITYSTSTKGTMDLEGGAIW